MTAARLHTGWYQLDTGRHVPGVTTVLSGSGLVPVAYFTVEAAERGREVANWTARLDHDGCVCGVDDELRGYVRAWLAFRNDVGGKVFGVEEVVVNGRYGYAGRLDRRMRLYGHRAVVEIKTGAAAPWHGWQLAAYAGCFRESHRLYAVYLGTDGKYKVKEHEFGYCWPRWLEVLREYKRRVGVTAEAGVRE